MKNHAFRLARRPVGVPTRDDFAFAEEPLPELGPGEVRVAVEYLSLDPAMRGWMNEARSYVPPVKLGDVMRALGGGRVVASRAPGLAAGDAVTGLVGVQALATVPAERVTKVDLALGPLTLHLGALGASGMTAYFGLLDVGRARAGDVVVVSAAAGSVGSVAGQIARIAGCHVVGIAGGPAKCAHVVNDLGFAAAIDYRSADVKKALAEHCPRGLDVYFDNVGGDILDAALGRLARGARVVICGAISQYNNPSAVKGPQNYLALLVARASMTGFVVFDYMPRYPEAVAAIARWIAEGKLAVREDIVHGLDTFPEALLRLFRGDNTGKLLLAVAA